MPDARPLFRRGNPDPMSQRVVTAVQAAEDASGLDPVLVLYTPVARMNPYQSLLYRAAWESGVAPVPVFDLADVWDLVELAPASAHPPVLHLHWTTGVLRDATDAEHADAVVAEFLGHLAQFRARGGRVAWTVHNTLPHEARHHEAEVRLQQGIADVCDVTHVLSPQAVETVRDTTRLRRESLLVVEHPSYEGCYPDYLSRHEARWALGIQPDETVFALVGSLRANKGLAVLHEAFDLLRRDHPGRRRLLVAGSAGGDPEVGEVLHRLRRDNDVLVDERRIPADDMQLYLRAADTMVLPYGQYLNSGAAMLGLTFGLPVVGSRDGALSELLTDSTGVLVDTGDPGAVAEGMRLAEERFGRGGCEAARELAGRHDADRLSRVFCTGLRDMVVDAAAVDG